ncbi:MAG TPA: glycoside hydrolase family 2 TIM barrel-domain containing protein [Pyrinomonadaceae bacterium]|jgi:hypothetical protein
MMNRREVFFAVIISLIIAAQISAQNITRGEIRIDAGKWAAGTSLDLSGDWFYRPDYAVRTDEKIESSAISKDDFPVGVPQFLNRVRWWLDDSEEFKKWEDTRLKKLGFDTEKAEEGWYKLVIDARQIPADKRVFIEFDGVAMKSKVFLNGVELGQHTGMFSRFAFDLTPQLKAGKNLLAVWVSMEKIPVSTVSLGTSVTVNLTASKVLSLSKGMFGPLTPVDDNRAYDLHGIWQPVRLTIRGTARLADVYFAPNLNGARITTECQSFGGAQTARLKVRLTEAKTNKILVEKESSPVELNSVQTTGELEVANLNPKLWTPAEPNLYRLGVTLTGADGKVLDRFTQKVGFRTFEARGNQLYLNGKPYWLRGTNQLPYGKNPWDARLARKLIQYLHDNNQRITRTHATPWNEAWLDAADEIGLGVSIEGIRPWAFVGKIGATPPALFEHWLAENADVVRRIRNHPSVLIWTIGNEMLLRDNENVEKWKQLSAVVKQTRALDPTRPTVVSSSYVRENELYNKIIKPNNIDDGDADDIHSYRGWYADSPFVSDSLFTKERRNADFNRPFIGQEISTGYPNLDDGLPTLTYTKNQRSPQAWVGVYAYPGSDPKYFLEHQKQVTKRLAEQLRFQRGDNTSGFLLFSAECWFAHSFDAGTVKPYPVLDYTKYAFAPVGLALETGQRKFFAGSDVQTNVFVTNDDERFRDYKNLALEISFVNEKGGQVSSFKAGNLASLKYYESAKIPAAFKVPPAVKTRTKMNLVLRLLDGKTEVSRTIDEIEVFPQAANPKIQTAAAAISLGAQMSDLASGKFQALGTDLSKSRVVLLGKNAPLDELKKGGKLYNAAARGATVVVFSPGKRIQDLFPEDVAGVKTVNGEFADWTPASGTRLVENLQPMDLKWWARAGDWRVMVASESHKLNSKGAARELIRFIPSHGYIALDRVEDFMQTVLFEIPVGKGRLWVCDLDLEESVSVDPAARIFAENLLTAAADPDSTRNLIKMPTHEEMLAGRRPPAK